MSDSECSSTIDYSPNPALLRGQQSSEEDDDALRENYKLSGVLVGSSLDDAVKEKNSEEEEETEDLESAKGELLVGFGTADGASSSKESNKESNNLSHSESEDSDEIRRLINPLAFINKDKLAMVNNLSKLGSVNKVVNNNVVVTVERSFTSMSGDNNHNDCIQQAANENLLNSLLKNARVKEVDCSKGKQQAGKQQAVTTPVDFSGVVEKEGEGEEIFPNLLLPVVGSPVAPVPPNILLRVLPSRDMCLTPCSWDWWPCCLLTLVQYRCLGLVALLLVLEPASSDSEELFFETVS